MAPDNVRTLHGKKQLRKPSPATLPASEEGNLLAALTTGLVNASIGVIPYPVALWSFDRRSCIFNKPTLELLGFSEEEFSKNSSLWMERIQAQDRDGFLIAWGKLQAGEKKVSCS